MRRHQQEQIIQELTADFEPVMSSLKRVAEKLRLNLSLEHAEGQSPHLQLSWTNARNYICTINITRATVDCFSLVGLCWGPSALLGRQHWTVGGATPVILEEAVHHAYRWAEGIL